MYWKLLLVISTVVSQSTSLISWNLPSVIDINEFIPSTGARSSESIPSRVEFLSIAENIVQHSLRGVQILNATCNQYRLWEWGKIPCFAASAGDINKAVIKSISMTKRNMIQYHTDTKLFNLLYLVEGDVAKAMKLLDQGVDFAMIVMREDPKCFPVFHEVEELAGTILGPGGISISESHADAVSNGWRVGGKASVYTSALVPVGSLEVTINTDYSKSIMRTTTETIRRDFKSPVGSSCTPSLLRVSNYCSGGKAHVIYGKDRYVFEEKEDHVINKVLLPNDADHGEFFTSILGCIDYTR